MINNSSNDRRAQSQNIYQSRNEQSYYFAENDPKNRNKVYHRVNPSMRKPRKKHIFRKIMKFYFIIAGIMFTLYWLMRLLIVILATLNNVPIDIPSFLH